MMMEDNKDIFDQFHDGQSAWETPPPPSAWERLESRLDAPPPPPKANPWKPFILPGLGILLLFVFLGFQLVRGWSVPAGRVVAEASLDNPIQSTPEQLGSRQSSNTPNDDIVIPPLVGSIPFLSVNSEEELEPSDSTGSVSDTSSTSPVDFQDQTIKIDINPNTITDGLVQEDLAQYFPLTNAAAFDYDTSGLRPGNMVVTNGYGNVLDTVHSLDQYVNRVEDLDGELPGYLQMNVARNEIGFTPRGNNRRLTPDLLEHFNYLLGSWKYKGPSASSFGYEEWDRVDEFNLEGRGYLVLNGDTVITERMRIEQKGEDVYYIVALDTNQTPMRFRLRSRSPGEAVFKQSGLQSNEEIILRSAGGRVESIHSNGKQSPKKRREEIRSLERSE